MKYLWHALLFFIQRIKEGPERLIVFLAIVLSTYFTSYYFYHGLTLAYGDAESHLNIAKRVTDSITPGFAQLGGVWLPLPHILMIPFVIPDMLWQTGIGGAIVSSCCFVVSALILYKIIFLLTKNILGSMVGTSVFMLNANILYMQSTPMTELPLIVFFVLSLYFFFLFLRNDTDIIALICAGFFGFCATLTRYDGWFLVGFEFIGLALFYSPRGLRRHILEGKAILFSTLAFFGVLLWLIWDSLILGDPLYFTNSPFSANSQQKGWIARGELPGYKNIWESFLYYFVTCLENIGLLLFILCLVGFIIFLFDRQQKNRWIIALLLIVPFIFYVATIYLGQSVIFIPALTPPTYQWRLFNVRYGVMMIPTAAILFGYFFTKVARYMKWLFIIILLLQSVLFFLQISPTITLQDGIKGLSASSHPNAEYWIRKNYNGGYILLDDYARTLSITGSNLPIQNIIYVGNKPYWQNALKHPEFLVTWVILQKGDAVWNALYTNPAKKAELYSYYVKAYTSPNILIFKRNGKIAVKQ